MEITIRGMILKDSNSTVFVIFAHTSFESSFKVGGHHLYSLACRQFVSYYLCLKSGSNSVFGLFAFTVFLLDYFKILLLILRRRNVKGFFDTPVYILFLFPFKRYFIYRVTDNYGIMSILNRLCEKLIKIFDFRVVTTNSELKNIYSQRGFNVLGYIVNGVSNEFINYASQLPFDRQAASEVTSLFYVGSIDARFDYDYIRSLLRMPEILIHIVSPDFIGFTHQRLIAHGALDWRAWSPIALICDAALMPFNNNPLNLTRSPMKKYEYYALGLPVLTSSQIFASDNCFFFGRLDYKKVVDTVSSVDKSKLISIAKRNTWEDKFSEYMDFFH